MKIFITGIDTDSGKSIATGLLAKYLLLNNKSIITQKYVQTGCIGTAEDLITHRKIMGIELTKEDNNGITCSYLFKQPASPHLSAQLEEITINEKNFTISTKLLNKEYEYVLMEGAGGLMVPLNSETLLIDYVQKQNYPVILVSTSKLGSINHTLLSLEVLKKRRINIIGLIYNQFPNNNKFITKDSEKIIKKYLKHYFPMAGFISIPKIDIDNAPIIDFKDIIRE